MSENTEPQYVSEYRSAYTGPIPPVNMPASDELRQSYERHVEYMNKGFTAGTVRVTVPAEQAVLDVKAALAERVDILNRFYDELTKATGDGSKKRQAGEKPPWYQDGSHEGAVFSHITKWKRGEKVDPDSGAHPLVHAAWRLLAIACIESGNVPCSDD